MRLTACSKRGCRTSDCTRRAVVRRVNGGIMRNELEGLELLVAREIEREVPVE